MMAQQIVFNMNVLISLYLLTFVNTPFLSSYIARSYYQLFARCNAIPLMLDLAPHLHIQSMALICNKYNYRYYVYTRRWNRKATTRYRLVYTKPFKFLHSITRVPTIPNYFRRQTDNSIVSSFSSCLILVI